MVLILLIKILIRKKTAPQQRQPKPQAQEFPDIDITDEEIPF